MSLETEPQGAERRRDVRVPIETVVRIEYGDLRGFVRECCRNVSVGGMFVECPNPPEVGRPIRFELVLPEPGDRRRIAGRGEVAWRRPPADSPQPPAGFGMRFTEIDLAARQMIFHIVDRFVQLGGTPFDPGAA